MTQINDLYAFHGLIEKAIEFTKNSEFVHPTDPEKESEVDTALLEIARVLFVPHIASNIDIYENSMKDFVERLQDALYYAFSLGMYIQSSIQNIDKLMRDE